MTKNFAFNFSSKFRNLFSNLHLIYPDLITLKSVIYYEAEGRVLELLETGAPYAPHVKAKIT